MLQQCRVNSVAPLIGQESEIFTPASQFSIRLPRSGTARIINQYRRDILRIVYRGISRQRSADMQCR